MFRAPRLGLVAGSFVTEGSINRNARARLVRDGVVVYDGRIVSLYPDMAGVVREMPKAAGDA